MNSGNEKGRPGKRLVGLAVLIALLLISLGLAACGGGGSSSSSESTTAEEPGGETETAKSEEAAEPTGTPIKVMAISADNNAVYNFPDVWPLAEAAADAQNAAGGINGHPIEVITCNDHAEPNAATKCAREAVSEEVVALVGGLTLSDVNVFPIIEAAGIPWIGNEGLGEQSNTNKYSFVTGGGAFEYTAAAYNAGKECKTVSVVSQNVPTDKELLEGFAEPAIKVAGNEFTVEADAETNQTDFSGLAAQVSQAGECLYMQLPPQQSSAMAKALQAEGSQIKIYSIGGTFTEEVIEAAPTATEGARVYAQTPPPEEAEEWAEAREAVEKYIGESIEFSNANVANTWTAMKLFVELAEGIKGEITPEAVFKAANSATKLEPGTIPPVNFSKPFPVEGFNRYFNSYVVPLEVTGGKLEAKGEFEDMEEVFVKGHS
ncbi:MAG: ABC transporter substrate-binding protein [Solirubrobacterales bacterium]